MHISQAGRQSAKRQLQEELGSTLSFPPFAIFCVFLCFHSPVISKQEWLRFNATCSRRCSAVMLQLWLRHIMKEYSPFVTCTHISTPLNPCTLAPSLAANHTHIHTHPTHTQTHLLVNIHIHTPLSLWLWTARHLWCSVGWLYG